jgi:hypothetical protein
VESAVSPGDVPIRIRGAVLALVGVAVLAYVTARAILVPLTYDEAVTVGHYAADGLSVFDFATATNHLVTTVAVALTTVVADAPAALRLTSIAAALAYLAAAAAWTRHVRSSAIGAAGFVILVANPYVADYFALARGYALGIAGVTVSACALARWLDRDATEDAARLKFLRLCVFAAGAAVIANFGTLPWFTGLVLVVLGCAWRPPGASPPISFRSASVRQAVTWLCVATAFSGVVFSRERVPTASSFVPVRVQIGGLYPDEVAPIRVYRADASGRLRPVRRQEGAVWAFGAVHDAWETIRIALPASADRNLSALELIVGDRVFRRDRRSPGPWRVEQRGEDRVLVSTVPIRWRPDQRHARAAAMMTAAALAAAIAFGAAVLAAGRGLVRSGVAADTVRTVSWSVAWVAAFAAAPIYLLARDRQLFFGGGRGLVADSVGSLVRGTAYGIDVADGVAGAVALAAALSGVLALTGWWRHRAIGGGPWRVPAAVTAVLMVAVIQIELQHLVAGTPYPLGRTALFLWPALVGQMVLTLGAAATTARLSRGIAGALIVVALAALWHVARVGNVERAFDWPADRCTPAMLPAVTGDEPSPIRLGIAWEYYPVAKYYAERRGRPATAIEPIALPGDGVAVDYAYAPAHDTPPGELIARYDECGAVLVRMRR